MDRFRDAGGYRRSLERASKLLARGMEAEVRGDMREAIRRLGEVSEIYASLGERRAFVDSEIIRGHCIAFQALSERAADKFKRLIEEAIDVINEVRKTYIKDHTLKGVERDVWISYCVNFTNALRSFLEESIPAKKELCVKVMKEGEVCVEWLEKLEESEKAGILLFWIGLSCVRCASWFEGEEKLGVLRKAAESFGKARKFFEAARRPRPYLCLEMMQEMCDTRLVLEGQSGGVPLRPTTLTVEPKEERCRRIHRYNLATLELEAAVREKFFTEKWRRINDVLSDVRDVAAWFEGAGGYDLAADVYYLLAKVCYEAFKVTLSNRKKRENLEECYEALKKAYMHAMAQMKVDVAIGALIMMPRVVSEYVKLADSDALKIKLVREGASYSREAFNEIKMLPEDSAFIGKFYNSVTSYLVTAAEVEVNEERKKELLENAMEYGEVSLEYLEGDVRKGEYMYSLAEAYYRLGRGGQANALEKAREVAKRARESFISAEDLVGAARASILSGDVQKEIWRQRREEEGYLRARQEYLEAVRVAAVMDWREMEGEALVKLAELEDEKGNYTQAAEYYVQALERLSKASANVEEVKEKMREIEARINIERGKELLRSQFLEAASYFRKGGELLMRGNENEAMFYRSLGEFLEAEAVSIANPGEALERLREASKQLKVLEDRKVNGKVMALLKMCKGKEHLEEGLALYASGANSSALVKFSMAAKALGEAAGLGEGDWERAAGYAFFAQGLERFIRGQLGDHKEFLEAANLFKESTKVFVTNKMKNAAFGFTDLCYGWHKFLEFVEEETEGSYIEARMHFERSLKFFIEAGLDNYAKYVEGLEYFLDGERYSKKLEEAEEAAEKYYALAEENYNRAKEKFSEAGHVGLEREVDERIQRLKERETKRRYLEAIFGGSSKEELESLRDGFVAVRVNEPADRSLFKVGDKITIKLELANIGGANAILEKLENAIPRGFKVIGKLAEAIKDGSLVFGREMAPWEKVSLEVKVMAGEEGEVEYQPVVIFRDNKNRKRYFKPRSILILVGGG